MANIGRTDTVPAVLTPGEVVLNDEQITLLGKITGRNPYELFAAAGVPGSEEQFAGTEGGQVPQGYQGGRNAFARTATRKEQEVGKTGGYEAGVLPVSYYKNLPIEWTEGMSNQDMVEMLHSQNVQRDLNTLMTSGIQPFIERPEVLEWLGNPEAYPEPSDSLSRATLDWIEKGNYAGLSEGDAEDFLIHMAEVNQKVLRPDNKQQGGYVNEYRGGGVVPDSSHESIDNLIMQNDMNDYSPSLLNMVQGYKHGTTSVRPEDMYAGLGYLEPGQDYIPETLPYDPSAQFQMYGTAAGSFEEQMERTQRGKGGLRRGRYESDIAEARKEATSLLGTKVGEARKTKLEQQVAGFYKDVREGIITPTKIGEDVPGYYEFGYQEEYEPSGAPPGWPTNQAYMEWRGAGSDPNTAVSYGYTGSGTPGYKPEEEEYAGSATIPFYKGGRGYGSYEPRMV